MRVGAKTCKSKIAAAHHFRGQVSRLSPLNAVSNFRKLASLAKFHMRESSSFANTSWHHFEATEEVVEVGVVVRVAAQLVAVVAVEEGVEAAGEEGGMVVEKMQEWESKRARDTESSTASV